MVLNRLALADEKNLTEKIFSELKEAPTKNTLHKIIKENKESISIMFSNDKLFKTIIDASSGRTIGHEIVYLSLQKSIEAIEKPEIWSLKDKNGWSIGHEAVRSHVEVGKRILEGQNINSLFGINDKNELSIGKVFYSTYKSFLSSEEIIKMENWIKTSKNKNVLIEEIKINDVKPIINSGELKTEFQSFKKEVVNINPSIAENKTEFIIQEEDEVLKDLNMILKNKGVNEVRSLLTEDKFIASYLISNNIGLEIIISPNGRKIGHYLAALDNSNAIRLISNPKTARIVVNNSLWSVCHEAVFYHKNAAHYAMESGDDLWGISDINGKSVGHVAVKNHKDIAMLTLANINSKKLLLVEDDSMRTVAHSGIYWSEFSIGILKDPDLYTLKDNTNKSLLLEAVKLHRSTAIKVQESINKYLPNIDTSERSELLKLLKAQLSNYK
ncbi:MAG: hypothetical protein QXD23_01335 [Candidatus Micrarchaeaceae archaeon]